MRALIQRVSSASVTVDGFEVGEIGPGLCVFLGVSARDDESDAEYIVDKTLSLRIFDDNEGKFNFSVLDMGAELLLVSQFTLLGNTRKGRRPSFTQAALPAKANQLFEYAKSRFKDSRLKIESGRFQEHMIVSIQNDGPVTIILDSSERKLPRKTPEIDQ